MSKNVDGVIKTSTQDFKMFRKYCKKWQRELGLTHYEMVFFHDNSRSDGRCWAEARPEDGIACVGLTKDWLADEGDLKLGERQLEICAFHEMREIALWPIRQLLEPYYSDKVINKHIHDIIRRDENLFFP